MKDYNNKVYKILKKYKNRINLLMIFKLYMINTFQKLETKYKLLKLKLIRKLHSFFYNQIYNYNKSNFYNNRKL